MSFLAVLFMIALPARPEATLSRLNDRSAHREHGTLLEEGLLSLPREAQKELFVLYATYNEAVQKRMEDGWYAGLLSGELVEEPDMVRLPARQTEAALAKRSKELKALEAQYEKLRGELASAGVRPRIEAKKLEVRKARKADSRGKGLCIDWSDMVWAELLKLPLEHWRVRDERRTAAPYHTSAVVCTPQESPEVCLAFDPWEEGRPDVFEFRSWDEGSRKDKVAPEFFIHQLPEPGR